MTNLNLQGVVTMELIGAFIMELIGAFIEIILKGSTAVGTNKKHSKWIRYPLLLLAGAVYLGFIAIFVLVGFLVLADGLWRAIFMWIVGLAFIVGIIWSLRTKYKAYKKKKSNLQ